VLEKLQSLPLSKRILIYILIPIVAVILFWNGYYSPSMTKIRGLKANLEQTTKRLEEARLAQKKIDRLNKEITEIEKKFYEVGRLLPTEKEIPGLLRNVSSLGNDAHLEFLLFEPQKEVIKDFYAEVPVRLKLEGEYLNMENFIKKLSELPRIINVSKLKFSNPKMTETSLKLKVDMQILTYRFIPKPKASAKKGKKQGKK